MVGRSESLYALLHITLSIVNDFLELLVKHRHLALWLRCYLGCLHPRIKVPGFVPGPAPLGIPASCKCLCWEIAMINQLSGSLQLIGEISNYLQVPYCSLSGYWWTFGKWNNSRQYFFFLLSLSNSVSLPLSLPLRKTNREVTE